MNRVTDIKSNPNKISAKFVLFNLYLFGFLIFLKKKGKGIEKKGEEEKHTERERERERVEQFYSSKAKNEKIYTAEPFLRFTAFNCFSVYTQSALPGNIKFNQIILGD